MTPDRAALAEHCRHAVARVLTTQSRPIAVAAVDAILAPHVLTVTAHVKHRQDIARALKLGPELAHAMRYTGPLAPAQAGGSLRLTMTLPEGCRKAPALPDPATGLVVAIGYNARNAPVFVDLANPSTPHGIIVGATGSGKSVLLEAIGLQLGRQSSQHDVHLYLADPQDRTFVDLRRSAHVQAAGWTAADGAGVVRAVAAVLAGRVMSGETEPAVFLLADELSILSDDAPSCVRDLALILKTGRKHGVHVVVASPDASTSLLDTESAKHFGLRVAGRCASAGDAYRVTGARQTGAELAAHPGDMVMVAPGLMERVQVPQPRRSDYLALPPRLAPLVELPAPEPTLERPVINPTTRRVLTAEAYAWIAARAERLDDGAWRAPTVRAIAAEFDLRLEVANTWQRDAVAALGAETTAPVPGVPGVPHLRLVGSTPATAA